jgi:Heat induced stress protein YflT
LQKEIIMAGKNTAAFGIYKNRAAAESAVDRLTAEGFSNKDVSVLMSDNSGSKDFATEKNTKAPEGATTGVGVGGAVGGTLGLLAGIGALAIPGVGPLIAAGPIMAGLAGLGVGGAVGGLVGALVGMGIPEYEAKRYEGRVKDGGILLSVHCNTSEEISKAKDILKATGAEDIASSGEKSVSTHGVDTDRQATDRKDTDRIRPSGVDSTRLEDESVNRKVIGGR